MVSFRGVMAVLMLSLAMCVTAAALATGCGTPSNGLTARSERFARAVMDTMHFHLDSLERFMQAHEAFRELRIYSADTVRLSLFHYIYFADTLPTNASSSTIDRTSPGGGYVHSEEVRALLKYYGHTADDLAELMGLMKILGGYDLYNYWVFPYNDYDVMNIKVKTWYKDSNRVDYVKLYWRTDPSRSYGCDDDCHYDWGVYAVN